jgi:SAM-dependent methyltransferase
MDQQAHWDRIGGKYHNEIFDVFKSDKNKVLPKYFSKHANPAHRAIDFGCGMGKAFAYLAPAFKSVLAIDISAELLKIARQTSYRNIDYKRADLTSRSVTFPSADFVFCCNVIMLPEPQRNVAMIRNIHKALRPGGSALIVMPSIESVMFSTWRMIEWYRKEGVKPEDIPNSEFNYYSASKRNILQGIIHIDGVPTKHFSEPELRVLFTDAGLAVTAIERIEYEWNTEFDSPPAWMKTPYPWDWLIECKKITPTLL